MAVGDAAERKSAGTIKTYSDGVTAFLRWCEATGTPAELTKPTVQTFTAELLDGGAEAATASARPRNDRPLHWGVSVGTRCSRGAQPGIG